MRAGPANDWSSLTKCITTRTCTRTHRSSHCPCCSSLDFLTTISRRSGCRRGPSTSASRPSIRRITARALPLRARRKSRSPPGWPKKGWRPLRSMPAPSGVHGRARRQHSMVRTAPRLGPAYRASRCSQRRRRSPWLHFVGQRLALWSNAGTMVAPHRMAPQRQVPISAAAVCRTKVPHREAQPWMSTSKFRRPLLGLCQGSCMLEASPGPWRAVARRSEISSERMRERRR
mmetsp:Transcript_101775/g.217934  ORF Transcript_101775/g.217934 Transcript_101775/m.217934 type:complete len:231 (+) Transcript_101775:417-1109(+)